MSKNELKAKVEQLAALRKEREALEAEIAALEDAVKAHMGEQEEVTVGPYRVRWVHMETRRFDTTAFRASHKRLYEQFTRTTQTRRFTLA